MVERDKTHKYMTAHFLGLTGTGTGLKCGGVKLNLLAQAQTKSNI